MNKKYFKIGFIIFFILFVIFIIIRKINIDSQAELKSIQNKSSKTEIQELKKEPDPRIKIELEDNTSKTSSKIEEETKLSSIKDEKLDVETNVIKEKVELNNKANINKETIETPIKENLILSEKSINKINEKVKEEIVVSEEIKIESINDLKKIKNEIIIDTKNNSFLFQNNQYKVGDKLGNFQIIKVEEKKIRFKKGEHLYYSLRFFS